MIAAMNAGRIRVLFGSTQKLGTGVNAQERAVAIHHLDIRWRPMDFDQRNGRGARKGNFVAKIHANNKIVAYVYATNRSLDAYKFNFMHIKQFFIRQLKKRRLATRTIDEGAMDENGSTNFAEFMAIVSGNTDLLDKAKLEKKIAVLESERQSFARSKAKARITLQNLNGEIAQNKRIIARIEKDWEYLNRVAPANNKGLRPNPLKLDGVDSADLKVIGKKLAELNRTLKCEDYMKIGSLFDFRILVRSEKNMQDGVDFITNKFMVEGLDGIKYTYNRGHLAADPILASQNFIKALDTMPKLMEKHTARCAELSRDIPTLENIVNKTWNKETELKGLREELAALKRKITSDLENRSRQNAEENEQMPEAQTVKIPDNVREINSLQEQRMVSGSDVVPDASKPKHVPGQVVALKPGGQKL